MRRHLNRSWFRWRFRRATVEKPARGRYLLYDHPNFEGRSQCCMGGEDLSDLGRAADWSDRIYSIRLFGRTTVVGFRDSGFRGASIVVDRDIPDLSRLPGKGFRDWARQISSIRIEGRGGSNRGRR